MSLLTSAATKDEQKPGVLEELAAERAALLEKESAELEGQASRLAEDIKELGGAEAPARDGPDRRKGTEAAG